MTTYVVIDGGAQSAATGTVTEKGNGQYSFAPSQADTNGNNISYLFVATGSVLVEKTIVTTACDPTTPSFGLSLAKTTNITGFNDIAATAIVSGGAITTSAGKVSGVALVDTLTTYTGNTPQTGDAYSRIGAAGAGLTSIPYTGPSTGSIASAVLTDTTDTLGADIVAIKTQTDKLMFDGSSNVKSTPQTAAILPSIPANWITASGINAGALNGKGDWLTTLGATAPANWINTAAYNSAGVTIPDARLANLDATVSSRSTYAGADTSGTTTLLGRLTSTRAANLDNLDATVSSRSTLAAGGVWDLATTGHTTAGTFGAAMNAAGSAGDPWATSLPGGYAAGTAGAIVGTNLNATISSRSTYAGADTAGTTTLLSRLTSTRAGNLDSLDAAISTRLAASAYTLPDNTTIDATNTLLMGLVASGDHTQFTAHALALAPATGGGGSVTVSGYAAGQDPASLVWAAGSRSLTDKAGFSLATSPPTTSAIAAAILATPSNLLATDSSGHVTAGTVSDKSGYSLASSGLDAISVESGVNARQALSPILAAAAGTLSGAGTGTITIKGGNVATTRIVATTDTSGNRSAVTLTLPG